jgi:hypothetical protein
VQPSRIKAIGAVVGLAAMLTALLVGASLAPAKAGPEPMYKLKQSTLDSGRSVLKRWNPCQQAITYQVNLTGLPEPKRAAMLGQVNDGFARLSAADGMTYRYTGSTAFVPQHGNLTDAPAEIVVAVVARSATDFFSTDTALGVGGTKSSTWSNEQGEGSAVVRGFVVLDAAKTTSLKAGFGKGESQGNLILHELGHATGLDHVQSEAEQMNPELTWSAPKGYGRGDLIGLKKLGKEAGCITIPAVVSIADLN